jgi:membrane protease YdiL (CAAX protease family)
MIDWIKRHPLITYFALAYLITWAIKAPLVAHAQGFISWTPSPYLHYIGGFGPMLAAMIMTLLISGQAGLKELAGRMFQWRIGLKWLAIVILGMPVLFVISLALIGVATGSFPDPKYFEQYEIPGLPFIGIWVMYVVCYGWGEETGWRGFALPRLQGRWNALQSALLLSVVWAGWHLMDFFQRQTFIELGAFGTFGWFMGLVCGSILFTWLYNSTKGSVFAVALMHGILDICTGIPNAGMVAYAMSTLIIVIAIALVIVKGARDLSSEKRQITGPIKNELPAIVKT